VSRPAAGKLAQVEWGLHGARMRLRSSSEEAIDYIRAHLACGDAVSSGPSPDLHVNVDWRWGSGGGGHAGKRDGSGAVGGRMGKDLFEHDGRLIWSRVPGFEGLVMDAGSDGDGGGVDLTVHCSYVPRDTFARMRYLKPGRRAKKTHRTFFKLMYYAAYYPMVWHLERTRGWGLLHASAVERDGKAIIFSGMGGVGKSTLALSLLADPSFRFISDNLILHDADTVYSLPEPVRLDPSSHLAIAAQGFAPIRSDVPPTAHPKPTYWVEKSRVAEAARADVVVLLRFTPRSMIRPLSPVETLAHLTAARDLVKEVEGYRSEAAFLSMAVAGDQDNPVEPSSLASLVTKLRAYLIGIGSGEPVSVTLARIREVCA
jgi:hypothetical protein